MEWRDEGVVLGVRGHGETSAIAELFTSAHGRCLGLVRGGRSRRSRPVLQAGNIVEVHWYARLEEHLGTFQLEPVSLHAGLIMDDRKKLAGLSTLAGLAQVLPEREPHPRLFDAMRLVLEQMEDDEVWPALLVRWEMGLLDELGFALDLAKCAATGSTEDLHFVSPRTGRAVSSEAAAPYLDKLFRIPSFLRGGTSHEAEDVAIGFQLTGHFLERHIFGPRAIPMPPSRAWLASTMAVVQ